MYICTYICFFQHVLLCRCIVFVVKVGTLILDSRRQKTTQLSHIHNNFFDNNADITDRKESMQYLHTRYLFYKTTVIPRISLNLRNGNYTQEFTQQRKLKYLYQMIRFTTYIHECYCEEGEMRGIVMSGVTVSHMYSIANIYLPKYLFIKFIVLCIITPTYILHLHFTKKNQCCFGYLCIYSKR